MDDSGTYMNVKFTKTDSRSRSRGEPDVSYVEINFKTVSETRVWTDRDGLNSTYSDMNFRTVEPLMDEDADPSISSRHSRLQTAAPTGAQKQEPKQNIGNRQDRKICLLCLVTFSFGAIVAGLAVYVSQTRQSLITSDQNYHRLWEQHQEMNRTQRQCKQQVHELNSALEFRTSENSLLDLSQRICLNNLSAMHNNLTILENNNSVLNSDLSELNRTHNDLRHQFNQLEMKYRNITEDKAQICQYLTRRTEQTCPKNWIEKEDSCYFISTLEKSYDGSREHCSNFDARLLEINSNQEDDFVSTSVADRFVTYWIGKCRDGNVISFLLYKMYYKWHTCRECNLHSRGYSCNSTYRFICEKSAHLNPDIPEEIQGPCQQPLGPTSIT
ncbi:uncharacterized protein [Hemitrygon akajei]|uniref:uncharacterized protein n=1 Tax=Hemitrygon akajei TaxID=2704970 RepID=UPI003BF9E66F